MVDVNDSKANTDITDKIHVKWRTLNSSIRIKSSNLLLRVEQTLIRMSEKNQHCAALQEQTDQPSEKQDRKMR